MTPAILLVDDKPENLLAATQTLADLDADIVTANNGEEALSLMLDREFAVVLLDARMPVMDGFEVIRLMGKVERTRQAPVILISAYHQDDGHIFEGYHLGAVDFLVKPFNPEILRGKVKVFLQLFRQAAVIREQAERLARANEEMEARIQDRTRALIEANAALTLEVEKRRMAQAQAMRSSHLSTLGALSGSIAHEINNPNNAINFNAIFLKRAFGDALPILEAHHQTQGPLSLGGISFDELRDTLPQLLDSVIANTGRIKGIVRDFKRLSSHDPEEADHAPLTLHDVINEVSSILAHQVRRHTDRLTISLPEAPLRLFGNPLRLEQVLINVMMNALQSLPDRGRAVHISAAPAPEENMLRVVVRDEGVGMNAEELDRITNPFFSTRREKGGTGLGLFISNRIIDEHGGRMAFESVPGEGTTVTIILPIAPGEADGSPPSPPPGNAGKTGKSAS